MIRFKKPKNELEGQQKVIKTPRPSVPADMCVLCPSCRKTLFNGDLLANASVCTNCGYHFRMSARERLKLICDEGSFRETGETLRSKNCIDFPGYNQKLAKAAAESGEREGVVTGTAAVGGFPCAVFVMEPRFMMGSMGSVIGEKLTALFELAAEQSLPVVGYTVSGGARMQEGILSLMQMAKTSAALARFSEKGLLYISVLTDPTTGGVTASFASLGDIILAEPGALIGFAGPRVIQQTIGETLPEGFQRAEFQMEHGFVDQVVPRSQLRDTLIQVLQLHAGGKHE